MNALALAFDNPRFQARHHDEGLLNELMSQLSLGIGVEDEDGVLIRCNQAFADYYAMSALDLIGMAFMERMELICPHVVEVNGQPVKCDTPMAAFFSSRSMQHDARGVIETTLRNGRSFRHERKSLTNGGRLVVVTDVTALRRLEADARSGALPCTSEHSAAPSVDETAQTETRELLASDDQTVPLGNCRLDLKAARLFSSTGEELPLTAMEFSLLRVFVENRGRILNRDQLLADAHDKGWEPFDRSIDLRISRIRKKIETNPAKPQIIRTVRGLGYIVD